MEFLRFKPDYKLPTGWSINWSNLMGMVEIQTPTGSAEGR
jgi:hypothetical protein